jgi:hypothetical protein
MKEYEMGRHVVFMEGVISVNKFVVGKSEDKMTWMT